MKDRLIVNITRIQSALFCIEGNPIAIMQAEAAMEDMMKQVRCAEAEVVRLRMALEAAARSLEIVAIKAGHDECLTDPEQIRGYASNRAKVALRALEEDSHE